MPTTNTITHLDQQLAALKESALAVGAKMITTNRDHYNWLATAYMWWVDAAQQPGYLESQYEALGKRFKKNISKGINFAPLCWLLWGLDNGLTDDKAGRWSKVLNALHDVYNSQDQYRTDSVAKLANYIEQNGGVDGLVGNVGNKVGGEEAAANGDGDSLINGSDDVGDEEVEESATYARATVQNLNAHTPAIYEAAANHYRTADAPVVPLKAQIDVNSDGLGVVVVRKAAGGYQVLGANSNQAVLEPLLMRSYLGDFSAAQMSTRAIYETLATQCLPKPLQKFYRALVDNGAVASKGKAVRRLMYRCATRDLVLSPIRAQSGVVTVAKLKHVPFENLAHDCALATYSRRAIEANLIAGRNINLYAAAHDDLIQQINHGSTTCYGVQVKHKFGEQQFDQHWWAFEPSVADRAQLVVDEQMLSSANVNQKSVDVAWVRKLATSFTEKWLASHGKHITREHQKVLGIDVTAEALTVHFVMRQGKFENSVTVAFDKPQRKKAEVLSVKVRSKDFAVAVQAMADIGSTSSVVISMDNDMVAFAFETDAAAYAVYVPTCNEYGTLSTKYLTTYEPAIYVDEEHACTINQPEGDFTDAE